MKGIQMKDCIISDTEEKIKLVRITSDQLGATPIKPTLCDTIELSKSAEAAAYRTKIEQWITSIRDGKYSGYDMILREIKSAQRALGCAKFLTGAGSVCTVVGIPALAVPEIGAPVTIIGALTLLGSTSLYSANKWAALGRT